MGLGVAGLGVAGLGVVGLEVAGLEVAGLEVAGLEVVALGVVGLEVVGLGVAGLGVVALAVEEQVAEGMAAAVMAAAVMVVAVMAAVAKVVAKAVVAKAAAVMAVVVMAAVAKVVVVKVVVAKAVVAKAAAVMAAVAKVVVVKVAAVMAVVVMAVVVMAGVAKVVVVKAAVAKVVEVKAVVVKAAAVMAVVVKAAVAKVAVAKVVAVMAVVAKAVVAKAVVAKAAEAKVVAVKAAAVKAAAVKAAVAKAAVAKAAVMAALAKAVAVKAVAVKVAVAKAVVARAAAVKAAVVTPVAKAAAVKATAVKAKAVASAVAAASAAASAAVAAATNAAPAKMRTGFGRPGNRPPVPTSGPSAHLPGRSQQTSRQQQIRHTHHNAAPDRRSRKRCRVFGPRNDHAARVHAFARSTNAPGVEFLQQHFRIGVIEQRIAAIVIAEDLMEKTPRRLQLPRAFLLCGMLPKHPPRTRAIARKRRIESSDESTLVDVFWTRGPGTLALTRATVSVFKCRGFARRSRKLTVRSGRIRNGPFITEFALNNKQASLPQTSLRIAAAQAQPVSGDVTANIARTVELTRLAADHGAKLVVFPEKFLSGYEPDLIAGDPTNYAFDAHDARLEPIRKVCRQREIAVVVGAATRGADGLRISSLVFNRRGEQIEPYHKQYLYRSETEIYRPGTHGGMLELDGWRLALGVCYDSGFPEHARLAALNGAHAYLVSALFSVKSGYHQSRIWFPARAFDNTVYVLMSNHVGTTGGWSTCGSSAIWSPYGDVLTEAGRERDEVITALLDPAVLTDVRARETVLADFNARGDAMAGDYVVQSLD
nr:Predicted amidohydrolase [Paraburkholderia sediminicola]